MELLASSPSSSPVASRIGIPEKPRASICQALRPAAFPGRNRLLSASRCNLRRRSVPARASAAASPSPREGDNGATIAPAAAVTSAASPLEASRVAVVDRVTKETNVHVQLNLDGSGIADCNTGIPFLDHMLDQLASHGLFDVTVKAHGDIHIDDHHTNEDVALAIGTDLSGRPHLSYDLHIPTERVGTYDTQLVEHFFQSLVNTSGMTLHIKQIAGKNSHHIVEATFKAFARALRQATEYDPRRRGSVPSSKGVLSRS